MDGSGEGIVALGRDADGGYVPLGPATPVASPSFLALHPTRPVLYAVSEGAALGPRLPLRRRAASSARSVEPGTASSLVCHVAVAPDGAFLVVSCWGDGSVLLFELEADGSLGGRHAAPASEDPYGEDRQSRAHSCLMLGGWTLRHGGDGPRPAALLELRRRSRARVPWQRDVGARMRPAALRAELGRRRLREHRVQRRGRDAHRTSAPGDASGPWLELRGSFPVSAAGCTRRRRGRRDLPGPTPSGTCTSGVRGSDVICRLALDADGVPSALDEISVRWRLASASLHRR